MVGMTKTIGGQQALRGVDLAVLEGNAHNDLFVG